MGSSSKYRFNEEDMVIDECLGYPKSYSKLCRDVHLNNPYKNGPPFSFTPYVLQPQEVSREKELDQIFPVTNPEAKPSTKPKIYANLKQLNHLGNRAFSLLFADGGNEELGSIQTVESHAFPTHFCEMKQKVGLAPAAIVSCQKEGSNSSSVLRNVDPNRPLRTSFPATAKSSHRPSYAKENDNANTYMTIAMARDSLRRKDETQVEIRKLDDELDDLKQKNEEERVALQDLESVLI